MFCWAGRGNENDAEELSQLQMQAENYRVQAEKNQKEAESRSREISKLSADLKKLQEDLQTEKMLSLRKTGELETLSSKLQLAEAQSEALKCGFVAIDSKYSELQQRYDRDLHLAEQRQLELRERLELQIARLEEDLRLALQRRTSDVDGTDTSQVARNRPKPSRWPNRRSSYFS